MHDVRVVRNGRGGVAEGSMSLGAQANASRVPWRVAGHLLFGAALLIPTGALLGCAALAAAAFLYAQLVIGGDGWGTLQAGSLTAVYLLIGLVGGALLGGLTAVKRTLVVLDEELRARVPQLLASRGESHFPRMPLQELHAIYEQLLDKMFAETIGRVPLPGWLKRFLRRRLRQAAVEDFLADCKERGVAAVGAPEVGNWIARKGVGLALKPAHMQLRTLRLIVSAVLVLLGGGIVVPAVLHLWQ
jgi:hypothetical protein